eukprot:CAMPEP_0206599412 /NCGR_PEP_ID=MMETSP0325_2-20121206/45171_1 /ASSEMBLY_ACC=CAM_ASM_000347 /TAXON_ID=2866 /ORGANISM="Crypthecodinium cohnii, Strain Seligo" /LENGTH=134 /DNA_ID=CAMNT_0054110493 /DNA_START=623 /DNA_END=1028 /DNA_ORIENTATION=+
MATKCFVNISVEMREQKKSSVQVLMNCSFSGPSKFLRIFLKASPKRAVTGAGADDDLAIIFQLLDARRAFQRRVGKSQLAEGFHEYFAKSAEFLDIRPTFKGLDVRDSCSESPWQLAMKQSSYLHWGRSPNDLL